MKRIRGLMMALCLTAVVLAPAARADEMDDVLKLVPGDFAVAIVVPNLEALGEKAGAFAKSVDPSSEFSIKEELENLGPMMAHIDFTKPMVTAQEAGAGAGGGNPMVAWVYVDGAEEKLKGMDGAAENAGIWTVPGAMAGPMFARIEGKYVVVASSPEMLPKAPEGAKSMAPAMAPHKGHLKSDSALVHVNFESIRPLVQAQLMQVKQMAPMLGMMMAGDPTNPMAGMAEVVGPAATTMVGLIEEFVKQTDSLDVAIGVSESAIDAALMAKFNDGSIQSFLSQSKAPTDPPLSTPGLENFTFAWGARFNGVDSPMATFGQMFLDAVKNAPPMPAPGGQQNGAAGGGKDKVVAALGAMVEAAKKSMGTDSTTAVVGGKQVGVSTFVGGDAKELVALQAKTIESGSNLMGSASYEKKGEAKRGGVDVVEFARMPSDDPMAAMMPERFAVGVLGSNAATVQGDEAFVDGVFAKQGLAPTRSTARAKDVVEKIGKGANGILLIDLAGVVQMVSAMFGTPGAAEVPPGPPVGAALNLTNNPARVDIHLPAKAISRVMQMQGGDAPM